MRHLRKVKQLRRVAGQRKALLKSLAVSLIEYGRIKTTVPKAKALQPFIEKVITKSKEKSLNNVRILNGSFPKKTVKRLFESWGPVFADRKGGYTRIIKIGQRISDASPMAFIELVEKPLEIEVGKKAKNVAKKPVKKEKKEEIEEEQKTDKKSSKEKK